MIIFIRNGCLMLDFMCVVDNILFFLCFRVYIFLVVFLRFCFVFVLVGNGLRNCLIIFEYYVCFFLK